MMSANSLATNSAGIDVESEKESSILSLILQAAREQFPSGKDTNKWKAAMSWEARADSFEINVESVDEDIDDCPPYKQLVAKIEQMQSMLVKKLSDALKNKPGIENITISIPRKEKRLAQGIQRIMAAYNDLSVEGTYSMIIEGSDTEVRITVPRETAENFLRREGPQKGMSLG